jgi:predicted nucleotidyltransferase
VFYEEVLSKLREANVRFVVVGAVAMNLHGVPRMTADLDLLVDLSSPNLATLILVFEELGYKPRLPVPAGALLDPEQRRKWVEERSLIAFTFVHSLNPLQEVDLLLESPVSFEEADRAKKVLAAGYLRIPVISLDHLITMKRVADRAQDAADVEALERLKRLLGRSE